MKNDISNYYIESGTGYPLILLHGNGEGSDYFCNQISVFAQKYHIYAVDTRGHGKTERGTAPFTIRQFADDLFYFMKEHNIEKANILGFSDGGNIALVFAIKYPDMVNKLILNGANLDTSGIEENVQKIIESEYKKASDLLKTDKSALQKFEMFGLMVNDPNIPLKELETVSAATLVIAGTNDLIKKEHTKLIADNIKNSTLCFIEGDHFIANKNPNEFNKTVLEFLQK